MDKDIQLQNYFVKSCIAYKVIYYYESLDPFIPLFIDVPTLNIPIEWLCFIAAKIFIFFSAR